MKVYVIEVGCDSDRCIYGATEDEDIARNIVVKIKNTGKHAVYHEFDTYFTTSANKILYQVGFHGNEICARILSTDHLFEHFDIDFGCEIISSMWINIFATNEEIAKKKACDIRAKYLSEKDGI